MPRPVCVRCKTAATLTSRGLSWCRNCLMASVAGKVRTHLSESAAFGQRVAVSLSGGAGSLLLLDTTLRLMDCGRKRRLFEDAFVVVVDTTAFGAPLQDSSDATGLRLVLLHAVTSGLRVVIAPAEAAFANTAEAAALDVLAAAPSIAMPTGPGASSGPAAHEPVRRVYDAGDEAAATASVDAALDALRALRSPGGVLVEVRGIPVRCGVGKAVQACLPPLPSGRSAGVRGPARRL